MNEQMIKIRLENFEAERKRFALCSKILNELGDKLSDSVHFSPSVYITVSVATREDLSVLMTLAPKWSKSAGENGIDYSAEVDGEVIQINARGDALPGTCKLVEVEYEIPAAEAIPAKPASIGKKMVVKCDSAISQEVPL